MHAGSPEIREKESIDHDSTAASRSFGRAVRPLLRSEQEQIEISATTLVEKEGLRASDLSSS